MQSKYESKQLNNMEVNRIYNMKKSNLDRQNKINEGKIRHEYQSAGKTKQISIGKNVSQIVFGTELEDRERSLRRSSMLPAGQDGNEKVESRRKS